MCKGEDEGEEKWRRLGFELFKCKTVTWRSDRIGVWCWRENQLMYRLTHWRNKETWRRASNNMKNNKKSSGERCNSKCSSLCNSTGLQTTDSFLCIDYEII
ncbi:hypothetical protein I3760_Q015800 [Carya illinoinensis]|nr:hypothetical protein I3760_Q015800 [Carya illinoinensis]